jgi:hypothetical protein
MRMSIEETLTQFRWDDEDSKHSCPGNPGSPRACPEDRLRFVAAAMAYALRAYVGLADNHHSGPDGYGYHRAGRCETTRAVEIVSMVHREI